MDRAASDRVRRSRHFAPAWTRALPGRKVLVFLLIAMAPPGLILLRTPSWATSRRDRRPHSAAPIKLRLLLVVDTPDDDENPAHCSLREAIDTANTGVINGCGQGTGFDAIQF